MTKAAGDRSSYRIDYGDDYVYCCFCKRLFPKDDTKEHGIDHYCKKCQKLLLTRCDNCGDEVDKRNAVQIGKNQYQCYECFSDLLTYCKRCRKLIAKTDAKEYDDDPYCERCYSIVTFTYIIDHGDKPAPIFHFLSSDGSVAKTNKLWERQNQMCFIGVELEVDTKRGDLESYDVESMAKNICLLFGGEDDMYAKHDGSLSVDGIEFVSHPMTIEAHMYYNWKGVLAALIHIGYLSHDTGVCGIHTHVNRTCFGADEKTQLRNINKMLKLYARFNDQIFQFSRRKEEQVKEYSQLFTLQDDKSEPLYDYLYRKGKKMAINVSNEDTIEFRIFNGTLNYESFIATLQFVDETIKVVNKTSQKEFESMKWEDVTAKIMGNHHELDDYLVKRGLATKIPKDSSAKKKPAKGRRR